MANTPFAPKPALDTQGPSVRESLVLIHNCLAGKKTLSKGDIEADGLDAKILLREAEVALQDNFVASRLNDRGKAFRTRLASLVQQMRSLFPG